MSYDSNEDKYSKSDECICDAYDPGPGECDVCGRSLEHTAEDEYELREQARHQSYMEDMKFLSEDPRRAPKSRF
jgi:hypothetical protein